MDGEPDTSTLQRPHSEARVLVALGPLEERHAVAGALEAHGYDPAVVGSAELMMALRDALPFDLLVIDSGVAQAARGWHRRSLPVLLVADRADHTQPNPDLPVGDFILRPVDPGELIRRCQSLLTESRRGRSGGDLTGPAGMVVRPDSRELIVGGDSIRLRPREAKVLALLLARRGEVVKIDTLLRDVWRPGPSSSRNLVEAQISRLRAKLKGTEAEGAIITVSGVGYLIR